MLNPYPTPSTTTRRAILILVAATSLALPLAAGNRTVHEALPLPPATPATTKACPLDVCLVSGGKLGPMGAPHGIEHQGQEIKICCKACVPDFDQEPARFPGTTIVKQQAPQHLTKHRDD